jgi:N-acetylgalactosamine kinase
MTASELQSLITSPGRAGGERDALLGTFRQVYGDDDALIRRELDRLDAALKLFAARYGDGPLSVWRAPARINILGEHVDYVTYLPTAALPFGSREHGMLMLFRANEDGRVRGASTAADYEPFGFDLDDGAAASGGWLESLYSRPTPAPHWSNYVRGGACFARAKYGAAVARGFDFVVDASVAAGGGASSSSALTVLAGAAIRRANGINFASDELAEDSAQAEWYAGTRGGAMDHTAICLAQPHSAVHIEFDARRATLVPLPDAGYRWLTFFTHKADKGREVMLEYNERAVVARLLIPAFVESRRLEINESLPDVLPESVTLAEIARDFPNVFRECERAFPTLVTERRARPLKLRDRARHHVGEVRRVAQAARLLADAGGVDAGEAMRSLGALLRESHASLRDLYEVSTLEVNRLMEIIDADLQVLGARLMGGGFGGNVLALTTAEHAPALVARAQTEYYAPRRRDAAREGAVMISTPGAGLSPLIA